MFSSSDLKEFSTFCITLVLFVLPGLLPAFHLTGFPSRRNPFPLLLAFAIGFGVSCLITVGTVCFWGWRTEQIALSIVTATLLEGFFHRGRPMSRAVPEGFPPFDQKDWILFTVVSILFLAALIFPFSRLGQVGPDGHMYGSLFGLDFLMRTAYSASALRGLPMENMFFSHQTHHYFVFYYTFVAFAAHLAGPAANTGSLLIYSSLVFAMVFVLALLILLKLFVTQFHVCALSLICGLFAYSYNSLYVLFKRIVAPMFTVLQRQLCEAGLLQFSDVSHGWYRYFLVEQHQPLALILFIVLFVFVRPRPLENGKVRSVAIGLLLATLFGVDSFVGTLAVGWYMISSLAANGKSDEGGRWVELKRTAFALGMAFSIFLFYLYTGIATLSSENASVVFRPNKLIIAVFPIYMLLEFGPLVIFAVVGIARLLRKDSRGVLWQGYDALLILGALCLFFMLFMAHPDDYCSDVVLRKGGVLLQLPLVLFSALGISSLLPDERNWLSSAKRISLYFLIVVVGLGTLIVDAVTFAGLGAKDEIAVVSESDYDACEWLRRNTSPDAIVQSYPWYSSEGGSISPVAVIGHRRMALGHYLVARLSQSQDDMFSQRYEDIRLLFKSRNVSEIVRILDKYSITHIYFGRFERERFGESFEACAARPDIFAKVYSEAGVSIFKYHPQQPSIWKDPQ